MGMVRSAAARIVSPARTPNPPLYVGMPTSRPISMEKYAMVLLVSIGSPCRASAVPDLQCLSQTNDLPGHARYTCLLHGMAYACRGHDACLMSSYLFFCRGVVCGAAGGA